MYQALRDVLGNHVVQNGSNITEERLRFDFSHPEKMTDEQKAEVERIVNEQIQKDLKVSFAEYPTKVAIDEKGALGQFGDRYGETVKSHYKNDRRRHRKAVQLRNLRRPPRRPHHPTSRRRQSLQNHKRRIKFGWNSADKGSIKIKVLMLQ